MVDKLFATGVPGKDSSLLDPGCGPGAFIAGVLRWCAARGIDAPKIVGIDSDPLHVAAARRSFAGNDSVEIRQADFLSPTDECFDYVIGNPPYVAITGLSEVERMDYRKRYRAATNRFDLYGLFFEQAVRQLKAGGRLVFITPEKFLYVESATALRQLLADKQVNELHHLREDAFTDLVTYPMVTTLTNVRAGSDTTVRLRNGNELRVRLSVGGTSWLPSFSATPSYHGITLKDISERISCGVATGADGDFVVRDAELAPELRPFAYRTIAGRQLVRGRIPQTSDWMLVPYDSHGVLLPESSLGALGQFLADPARKARLLSRTCARSKAWYAFHENPPMPQILRPKLLCKDIGSAPHFFEDAAGIIIPRHSVYYILPRRGVSLESLAGYLNSPPAQQWLIANCQRAAKGFLRMQSHVLKRLPVPASFSVQGGLNIGIERGELVSA